MALFGFFSIFNTLVEMLYFSLMCPLVSNSNALVIYSAWSISAFLFYHPFFLF